MKVLLFVLMAGSGWLNLGPIEAKYCHKSGAAIVSDHAEYVKFRCVAKGEDK